MSSKIYILGEILRKGQPEKLGKIENKTGKGTIEQIRKLLLLDKNVGISTLSSGFVHLFTFLSNFTK